MSASFERLTALLEAAKRIADPNDSLGKEARRVLPESTGLSPEGVELALISHLEHRVHRTLLRDLGARFARAPKSHVLLSANVFVGAFRAIAIALSQSETVFVRPSRREADFARLLFDGSRGSFTLVSELSPAPGDHVWAYGRDETLRDLLGKLPSGVVFHGKGAGMGAIVVSPSGPIKDAQLEKMCDAIVSDVVPFDQRGCLSPRLILLHASRSFAETFSDCLAERLALAEQEVPRGRLAADERTEMTRYERTMSFVGGLRRNDASLVMLDPKDERLYLPPSGRVLHVAVTKEPLARLSEIAPKLTTVGLSTSESEAAKIRALLPNRRLVGLGEMQHPSFDGPVDLRTS